MTANESFMRQLCGHGGSSGSCADALRTQSRDAAATPRIEAESVCGI